MKMKTKKRLEKILNGMFENPAQNIVYFAMTLLLSALVAVWFVFIYAKEFSSFEIMVGLSFCVMFVVGIFLFLYHKANGLTLLCGMLMLIFAFTGKTQYCSTTSKIYMFFSIMSLVFMAHRQIDKWRKQNEKKTRKGLSRG